MFEKTHIFAGQDCIDKIRGDIIEIHLQSIGASQSTIDLSIDVKDRVALGHVTDCFQVKGLCPESVESEDAGKTDEREREQRQLPGNTNLTSAFFLRSASKKLHRCTSIDALRAETLKRF